MPPQPVLTASCDVYFTYCHNQPYSYFHEETFRRKVTEGLVPEYLLFAVLAMALRFSTDPYWQGMQAGAADAYASASWKLIVSQQLIQEDGMNLQVVQAANILAVIDFTGTVLSMWNGQELKFVSQQTSPCLDEDWPRYTSCPRFTSDV